jgi:hypothetical protein
MRRKVTALLLFHQTRPYNDSKAALENLAFSTVRAQSFAEACQVLSRVNPPLLVFTESELPDGNWSDVVTRRDLFREFSHENFGYFLELHPAFVALRCFGTMG